MISIAKSDGVVPVLIIFPSPVYENAPPEAKIYAATDISLKGTWEAFVIALGHIRRNLRELAEENNIPIIDVNSSFEKLNDNYKGKFELFIDSMHLTPKGNKLIAETMLKPIKIIAKQSTIAVSN